jgi:hypothetical protein
MASGAAEYGVALCGSGIGISIAVNRHPALRCALVSEPLSAALAREHNNANAIAMGARLTGPDMAKACLTAFLPPFGAAATPAASKSSPTPPFDPQGPHHDRHHPAGFFTGTLADRDPEIAGWINKELSRQRDKIELIARKHLLDRRA